MGSWKSETGPSSGALAGWRILVAEDEVLLADDLAETLEALGAEVLGPAYTVAQVEASIEAEAVIDAAILDINLRRQLIFPVADRLAARGVPLVFATAYHADILPERHAGAPCIGKAVRADELLKALHEAAARHQARSR